MAIENKKGGISVEAEHIFPIIKKWLYSDKEIFLREIVSNAVDAETKLRRLVSLGEVKDISLDDLSVTVALDREASTITVTDNGIGMTADEVEKYICSIALSGALDFIKKYEGEGEGAGSGIIGHFGLGFYSAFMVSDRVEVLTRSYTGAPAVLWKCDTAGQYEMSETEEDVPRGTTVTMFIGEEGKEFLDAAALRGILEKYCSFLPVPVYYEDGTQEEAEHDHEHRDESGEACTCCHEKKPINDTHPLWQKNPSECTKEEYDAFYRKVFHDWREPLLTIHLNADYPLNFKGILYFPRKENEFENPEGQVKLYYNQMFVADNIKEVIPEYLLMLRGVLDCPELPLNVSRSYLQNNSYVKKIAAYITKKVADKLTAMKENEREQYEKIWKDIKTFVEYGCLCDPKFYDRAGDAVLLPLCGGGCKKIDEYLTAADDKHKNTVYYANDETAQAQFISLYRKQGIEVALLDRFVDSQFITLVEGKRAGVKFFRVDADVAEALKSGEAEKKENAELEKLFRSVSKNDKLKLKLERLADASVPAILTLSEESRRFDDMMKLYTSVKGEDNTPAATAEETLCLNVANPISCGLAEKAEFSARDRLVARQLYALSALSQRRFGASELEDFLTGSYELLHYIPEDLPEKEEFSGTPKEPENTTGEEQQPENETENETEN